MAKKKLFKTAQEIFEGYALPKPTGKRGRRTGQSDNRKVTLKARELPSGNVQLFLYSFSSGKAIRFSVGLLNPEKNEEDKARNMEILRMARAEEGVRNADAIRRGYGLEPQRKRNVLLSDYLRLLIESNTFSKQTRVSLDMLLHHIETYRTATIKISLINKAWFEGFIAYLRNEAISRVTTIKRKHITQNTQARLFEMLGIVLARAVKDGILSKSPMADIKPNEKPKPNKEAREYLSVEEVKMLVQTPCSNEQMKRAFLFSVFTGLRWSDIVALSWSELKEDDNGKFFLLTMKKTKKQIRVYLSQIGLSFLPERTGEDDAPIFQGIPKNGATNKHLKTWAKRAGITGKNVCFHVARHTFATMMLNNNTPLEIVAKMMGHERLATTEIYAKILNRSIAAATLKQDEFFRTSDNRNH
jgi:integrase